MTKNLKISNQTARKFAIAVTILSVVIILSACNGDDGAQGPQGPQGDMGLQGNNGMDGQSGNPGFPSALFYLSNNGSDNAGSVDLINQNAAKLTSIMPGNNEGVALDALNNLVQAGDASVGSLRTFCHPAQRGDDGMFDNNIDREITGINTGLVNPKGIHVAQQTGLVMVADFNGMRISIFGSASAGDVAPLAETTTDAKPWDLDYDQVNDRLFVALTDGTVAVYDNYVASGFVAMPARVITPSDDAQLAISVNIHGIVYDRLTNKLVLSDVGDASSATDGAIFVIDNASSANGNVSVARSIKGPTTLLGNPVDIVLSGADLRVAEKSNDAILVFSNIFSGPSGDIAPDLTTTTSKPESLVQWTALSEDTDVSDIASTNVNFHSIAASSNPSSGQTLGIVRQFGVSLDAQIEDFDFSQSIESVTFDIAGDAYATFDDPVTVIAGILIGNRIASQRNSDSYNVSRDRMISGSNTGLVLPKGIDVSSHKGLIFVADFNASTPGIKVFSSCASGNVSPVLTLTPSDSARPWDVDYDAHSDKAYVALTNGTVAVFDEVTARMKSGMTVLMGQDRTITPAIGGVAVTAPTNIHGIDFDPASGSVMLSDVGSATDPNDGKIYVIPAAKTADGLTDIRASISGANTNLGNPVDIMYSGNNLYVAEKSNNLVMRFDDILNSTGGNIAPNSSINFTAPESVALIPNYILWMK